MERNIKIGIFGVGHNHAANAIRTLKQNENIEIVGLCEEDPTMLERRREENPGVYDGIHVYTKQELLNMGLDAAMVETSVPDLVPQAIECAEHGLHIHMDKPAGTDLAAYQKLLTILKEKKLVYQTGYMYRYNAGVRYIMRQIEEGRLGKIHNITATMSTCHPSWFKKQLIGYGVKAPVMFIFGGHLLDLCLKIKGEPEELRTFHTCSGEDGLVFEDTSLAVLKYQDGIATVKVSSVEVNGWGKREFTVYGEKGSISVSPIEAPMIVHETILEQSEPWKDCYQTIEIPEAGRYDVMMQEFLAMIRGDIPYDVDFDHEYLLQKYTLSACGYTNDDF